MKVLILSLMVFSLSAFAADKKMAAAVPKKDLHTGTLDIETKGDKEEIVDQTTLMTDKEVLKAEVTCKTLTGLELKPSDAGYKACLKKAKSAIEVKLKKVK